MRLLAMLCYGSGLFASSRRLVGGLLCGWLLCRRCWLHGLHGCRLFCHWL